MYFSKAITLQRARNNSIMLNVHSIEKRLKLVINFNNNCVLYYLQDNFRESNI